MSKIRSMLTKVKLNEETTILQDASIIPAIKSKKEVRALSAMERLFWLMDQKHSAHLTVTAQVKGATKVESWRDALDAVQRRHPVLCTSIDRNEQGEPAPYRVNAAPIPLRVVDGNIHGSWESELNRERAVPFTPEQAPLVRSGPGTGDAYRDCLSVRRDFFAHAL
jgi:hypothetical protein